MVDIDIDPFGGAERPASRGGEHDRTESRTDETGENIPIPPVGDQLGNQNVNKKHHSEEKVIELNS